MKKKFIIVFILIFVSPFLIEFFSWSYLDNSRFNKKTMWQQLLDGNFPASIRIDNKTLLSKNFKNESNSTFNNDPVLKNLNLKDIGYYNENNKFIKIDFDKEFWDNFFSKYNNKKYIFCLGSSTTAYSDPNNWPTKLSKNFNKDDFKYVIFNLGIPSISDFDLNNFLFFKLLPEFENRNYKPELVISLDGVTNLNNYFSSLQMSKNHNTKWFNNYGQTHQYSTFIKKEIYIFDEIFNNMKIKYKKLLSKTYDLNTLSGKILNKINYEFQRTNKFIFSGLKIIFPHTLSLLEKNNNLTEYKSAFNFAFHFKDYNVYAFLNKFIAIKKSQKLDLDINKFEDQKILIANNLENITNLINSKKYIFKSNLLKELRNTNDWSKIYNLKIDSEEIDLIKKNFNQALTNRELLLNSKNIKYISALQPLFIHNYSVDGYLTRDIPNMNFQLVHWAMRGSYNGSFVKIPFLQVYQDIEKNYTNSLINNSLRLNLNSILKFNQKDFTFDGIHYRKNASELIANTIFQYNKLFDD